jgi:hypothetical protein
MFKQLFQRWIPVVIVLVTVINLIASYQADNSAALNANIVALLAWIYVAVNEFTIQGREENAQKDMG